MNFVAANSHTKTSTLNVGLYLIWHLVASQLAGKSEPTMSVFSFGHVEILQIAALLLVGFGRCGDRIEENTAIYGASALLFETTLQI